MIDFFTVITKGGLVLWCFQDVAQRLESSINATNSLIKDVVMQERTGSVDTYNKDNLSLKMAMDNEFDLLYIVIYQKILQLSYVDKFLTDVQKKFRDLFEKRLQNQEYYQSFDFSAEYHTLLRAAEEESKILRTIPLRPRTFQQSEKSKKTIDSMIERKGWIFNTNSTSENEVSKKKKKKKGKGSKMNGECNNNTNNKYQENGHIEVQEEVNGEKSSPDDSPVVSSESREASGGSGNVSGADDSGSGDGAPPQQEEGRELDALSILRNRQLLFQGKLNKKKQSKQPKVPKKGKEARTWDLDGKDSTSLDYSRKGGSLTPSNGSTSIRKPDYLPTAEEVGSLTGDLRNMEVTEEEVPKKSSLFSMFTSLVSGKTLESADVAPVLEKFRDTLIGKNVASEIAHKLVASVETKLIGKHVGSFEGVTSVVKTSLIDSLMTLLTPKRRMDILRDVREAKANNRPYTITFCGVNGVGKSTNLAKVCFWLIENNFRVMIAACDTFRAGAVEQLRTHTRHLNDLHPPEKHDGKPMVELYEQGYGKDAADIARMAIETGRKNGFDVVLIDTAGRMQDNEPLMRALAKLIVVNEPDLTLFVGEALVGNEAVDQLLKFNRALANHSNANRTNTQMIDGILLTKFDTIDDKVGAAISMTYITGQPIVFVGTGQKYIHLRNLDAKAVVHLLMK